MILIFIQGCIIEPIEDDEPVIPEPPSDPDEPITDLPDPELPPIDKPDPKKDKDPYIPPTPPINEPPDEPPEDDSFCKTIIDPEDNNVNLGCEDNTGKHYDQCISNQPIQYQCEQNKCIKQEIDPCNECSFCTSKDERSHPKLAPERTYYCKENQFDKFPGQLTCECSDLEGQRYITGPTLETQQSHYNDLVKEHCKDNWNNVCRTWTFDSGCVSDNLDMDCRGGTNCNCLYGITFHITCKTNMGDTDPIDDFTCNSCPNNFESYCIEPPEEDVFLCDFCMENC